MTVTSEWICFIAGPVITLVVGAFKGLEIVADHPKIWAFVLSVIFSIVSNLAGVFGGGTIEWEVLAQCLILPFSTAVATHEVVKERSRGGSV